MSASSNSNIKGQTLIEFAFTLLGLSLMITYAGGLIRAQWQRSRCAYLAFENTHSQLMGSAIWTPENFKIKISQNPESFIGEANCENAHEKVELHSIQNP